MKECKTTILYKFMVIITILMFAIFAGVVLSYIVFSKSLELYAIIVLLFLCWMTVFSLRRFVDSFRKILYDNENVVFVFSKNDKRIYKWEEMKRGHIKFSQQRVILSEKQKMKLNLFGWSFNYTKNEFVIQLSPAVKEHRDFIKMLNQTNII